MFSEPIDGDPTEPVNSRFRKKNRPFRTFSSWNEKTDATIASWLCFNRIYIYSTGREAHLDSENSKGKQGKCGLTNGKGRK